MPSSRAVAAASVLFLLLAPAPLALAAAPPAAPALPGVDLAPLDGVGTPALPALPALADLLGAGEDPTRAARTYAFQRPGGEPFLLDLAHPLAFVDGDRDLSVLGLPPEAGRKVDPALLDVRRLVEEGLVSETGEVRVIVRGPATLALHLEAPRVLDPLGLVAGRVRLADLGALAALPAVERVHLDRPVQATLAQSVQLIRADQAHQRTDAQGGALNGTGVTVAILDTGVDYTHPDLGGCLGAGCKVAGGFDVYNGDADPMDDHGHGTHVAATAAGAQGVAPGATVLAYKVLNQQGSGWMSDIAYAIQLATAAGADVVSMSLGGDGTSDGPLAATVDWAVEQGVVVVSAAGNSGYWGYQSVGEPAASLRGIAVGATDKSDRLAEFSSRGPVRDSQQTITGVKPDLTAPGVDILAAVPGGACSLCHPSGYLSLSGTSMATPHVSGAAALLLQARPDWSPDDVKAALMASGRQRGYEPRLEGEGRIDVLDALDATVVPMPGTGWLGLDLEGRPEHFAGVRATLRNLGQADAGFSLSSNLTLLREVGPVTVDGGANASDPAGNLTGGLAAPLQPHQPVTLANVTPGGAWSEGAWVELRAPGEPWARSGGPLQPDPENPGKLRAFLGHTPLDVAGVWRVTAGASGVDFRVGAASTAAGLAAPAGGTLRPGESVDAQAFLTLDNALVPSGWHAVDLVVATEGRRIESRASFAKASVLGLHFEDRPTFGVVLRDGRFHQSLFFPDADVEVVGPSGRYAVRLLFETCPEGVSPCAEWSSATYGIVDDVEVFGTRELTVGPQASVHEGRVVVHTQQGEAIDARRLEPCMYFLRPLAQPCIAEQWTRIARASDHLWITTGGWSAGQFFPPLGPDYTVGLEAYVHEPGHVYVAGAARAGVDASFVVENDPATERILPLHRNAPVPYAGVSGSTLCVDDFGFSPILPMARGTTLLHYGMPDYEELTVGGGKTIYPVHCQRIVESLHAGLRSPYAFFDCADPAGCAWLGQSHWIDPNGTAFDMMEWTWYGFQPVDDRFGRRDGGIAALDGAASFAGDTWAGPYGAYVSAHMYNEYFTPGSPAVQGVFQYEDVRLRYEASVEGGGNVSGPLSWFGTHVPVGVGNVTLDVIFEGSTLEGAVGRAVHRTEFNNSGYLGLPRVAWARVLGDGAFGTVFDEAAARSLRFALHDGFGRAPADVSVRVRGPLGEALLENLSAQEGVYAADLPDLGAGAYDLAVSALMDDGVRVALVQEPAFLVRPALGGAAAPTVNVTGPAEGATLSRSVHLVGTAADAEGDWTVRLVEVSLDGGAWTPADGTVAWSLLVDTMALANGVHTLDVRASDGARVGEPVRVTFQVLNDLAPSVTIVEPAEGAELSGWATLRGNVSDPEGVTPQVYVSFDGGSRFRYASAWGGEWLLNVDVQELRPGNTTVVVMAWDGSSLSERVLVNVTLKHVPRPALAFTSPAEGATVDLQVAAQGTAAASAPEWPVRAVHVRGPAGEWKTANGTEAWNATFDVSGLAEGPARLEAFACDDRACSRRASLHLRVDHDDRALAGITWPHQGAALVGDVVVTGAAKDPDGEVQHVLVTLNGVTRVATGGASWSLELDADAFQPGDNALSACAVGSDGACGPAATMRVQHGNASNQPPAVAILSPAQGQRVNGTVWVTGSASDPDGDGTLQGVEVRVGGGAWRAANGTTGWNLSFDSGGFPEGNLTLQARAYDGQAHSAPANVTVVVDRDDAPANAPPKAFFTAPQHGATVSGLVHAKGAASDPDGNATLKHVEYRVGAGPWRLANGTTAWDFSFDSRAYPDGPLALAVRAYDGKEHSAPHEIEVTVSNPVAPPPCGSVDLRVASLEVVRTPVRTAHATVDNDVAERRVVRAVVVNEGACAAGGFTLEAVVRAAAHVPGTTTEARSSETLGAVRVEGLAPGANATYEFAWDATGNVGDQSIVATADAGDEVAETDEANNARRLDTYLLVGGLGGVALAPLQTPSVDLDALRRLLLP